MWRFSVTKPYVVEAGSLPCRSFALFDLHSQIMHYLHWSSNLIIWKYGFVCMSLTVLHVELSLVFLPYRSYVFFFFLSSFRLISDYCHAQEQQQKRNLEVQNEITFFKNKLYMHNLQKELRMGTAWSVNKNPRTHQHSHWNFIKLWLLYVTFGFKEKNTYELVTSVFPKLLFFSLLFLHIKAVYILTLFSLLFFFLTFLLNNNIKEPI